MGDDGRVDGAPDPPPSGAASAELTIQLEAMLQTCAICRSGFPFNCVHRVFVDGAIGTQSRKGRISCLDGTLVPNWPADPDLIPRLLATS